MKKLRLIKYLTLVTVLFVGCNELLEAPQPPTSAPGEQVLTSEAGVEALRASLYSQLRASFDYTTEYFVGPSAFADETRTRDGATRFQALNVANGNDGGTSGLSSYGDTYGIILDANLMIDAIPQGVVDDATLAQYRGEAFALRAFAMHHLVRALGYEPGMELGGFDLGIIIRTEPTQDISDVDERPRSTVSAVYSQIMSDLGEAKTLLAGRTNVEYVTEAFVDGLTARVHLYAGNWADADDAAADAIANSGATLENTAAGVADMFDETAGNHPEALFKLVVDPNTEQIAGSNVNNGLAAYTASQWVSQVPTNFVIDLYDAADHRLGWFGPCTNEQQGTDLSGTCTSVNDEGWEIRKWQGENGNLSDDIPYMRLSEMYLIQAEAKLKEPGGTVLAALGPLNTLREARGLTALTIADPEAASATALMDEILEERVRELVAEGHRFWDLKRLGRDIPNPDGSTKIRYDSYRILDDIGQGLIDINPELVENPGYLD